MRTVERLVREGTLDQASRLIHGPYVYASLLVVLALTTNYRTEHPLLFWAAVGAISASMALRIVLLIHREALYDRFRGTFQALLWLAVSLSSASVGALYVSALLFYGFESWTSAVLLIWTVGSASGATSTFTPMRRLLFLHVALLLGPALGVALWTGGGRGNTFAIGTGVLMAFLLTQGIMLHSAYWKQLEVRATEEARLREVEGSKLAAEAASRAKSQFLANMSHELRTPMHGILGTAEVALSSEMPPDLRQHLEVIQSSGQALLQLLNEILDFSKVEAGKLRLEAIPFSLPSLLEEIRLVIVPLAQLRGLAVEWKVTDQLPPVVTADAMRLRQVLLNLLGNALKFTSLGAIGLTVDVVGEDAGGVRLNFRITDTGIGIPADKQTLIFQAFAQADGSVTRKFGGTGLGLAISAQLVELMGGKLQVDSEAGAGSTFHFQITVPRGTLADAESGGGGQPLIGAENRGLRVLVGEDNRINQRVAKGILEKRGHSVTIADNGIHVLDAWLATEFDVILIDNQMPEMGGMEAVGKIREYEQTMGRRRTPAIMVTASAMAGDREKFLTAGLDAYVTKPFDAEQLESVLREIMARR